MSDLTTEEKVYLIECFDSRGKVYANAYRGFRTKFGQHKVFSIKSCNIFGRYSVKMTAFF